MNNKFSLEIYNPDSPVQSIKKLLTSRRRSGNVGNRLLILCHPLGRKYYQNYKEAMSAGFDQVITYCEWIRTNLPTCDVALEDERVWLARNLGVESNKGMVNTLYESLDIRDKQSVISSFDQSLHSAGYMDLTTASKKLYRKEAQDNYLDGEIVVIDADYINVHGIKALVSYAQRNELALSLHIPAGRINQGFKAEVKRVYDVEVNASAEILYETTGRIKSSKEIRELVSGVLESANNKHQYTVLSDNTDFRVFFEIALANSDIPFSALDGSIVGTSRGIRAYCAYINFLMSDGVELLKEFCGEIRVDYPAMVKLARSKKESLKFSDYRRVITECFFTEMNREASLLLEVIEAKSWGVNKAAKIFSNAIEFQLNDFEKHELEQCLKIMKDLDISERLRVFSRLQHYQLAGNFKIRICSIEYALQNHVSMNKAECILVESNKEPHQKVLCELLSIYNLTAITEPLIEHDSNKEVA